MNRPTLSTSTHARDDALAWFVRRNNEAFSAEEEQAFQDWLAADPERQSVMAHWQAEWQAFDAIPAETRQRLQGALAIGKAQASARRHRHATPQASSAHALARRRVLVPALVAVLAVVVTAGGGRMAWTHWQAQPVYTQTFSTPRGQQADVTLPDGSRLRLDAATRLQVTYYRQRREVLLNDGQAVFSVKGDATKPFHVQAGPVRVTVVGTRFMVRHLPDMPGDKGVQVAVEEGRVRVERTQQVTGQPQTDRSSPPGGTDDASVVLGAGQQVASDAQGVLAAVTPMAGAAFALWRDNRVRFDNTRLDQALAELARYRDPLLVVRDPAVAALRVTGVFDPRDPTTFKRVLPISLPVRMREEDGTTEVVLAR